MAYLQEADDVSKFGADTPMKRQPSRRKSCRPMSFSLAAVLEPYRG